MTPKNPGVSIRNCQFTLLPRSFFLLALCLTLSLCRLTTPAAPFAEEIQFTQPDGTQIVLRGHGDEFYAVFESLDGYTVVFNHQTRAYDYANLSADGNQLVSTGLAVGRGNPAGLGLRPHLRINPAARRQQAAERFARWDQAMEVTARWNALKAERRPANSATTQGGVAPAPPSSDHDGTEAGIDLAD